MATMSRAPQHPTTSKITSSAKKTTILVCTPSNNAILAFEKNITNK
jgi:hypothetical protein